MSKKKSNYIIYTDGGCAINPGGPGGCAAVIINTETGEYKTLSEGYVSTTNNRMEMQAIILALNAVDAKNLTVYSDSTYVIKTMNGQFSKKKNKDLWAKISAAAKGKHITWEWVRGHNGDQYNEMCDALCTEAMNGSNLKIDKGYAGQPVAKKTEKTNPGGAMGVLIEIPPDFIDQKLSLTEPTGKPVGFCWRDSSTCVHRIVAHRLWQAHLLRSSRYGHAARRPQLSSKMPDRPYSQNTVYPVS